MFNQGPDRRSPRKTCGPLKVDTDGSGTAKCNAKSVEMDGSHLSKTGHRNNRNTDGDGGGILSTTRSNNKFEWASTERLCSV